MRACCDRGHYNVEPLIAKRGADVKMPDFLVALANCEKARWSASMVGVERDTRAITTE